MRDHDDGMVGRLLTRREIVALFGASGLAAIAGAAAGRAQTGSAAATAPCVVQPQQTEGPYFVDEKLNRSDVRADPATGAVKAGVPLELTFKVSQVGAAGACVALAGARVDIWQCDALGVYSGVRDRNFDTTGQKFLRGHQIADATGTARFVTIYPGWYPGRAVHIHFKVRTSPPAAQAYEFTSQLYFDEALSDRVFEREPYSTHEGQRTRNESDGIYRSGGAQLMLPAAPQGSGYAGTFALAMRLGEPPPAGRRGRGRGGVSLR